MTALFHWEKLFIKKYERMFLSVQPSECKLKSRLYNYLPILTYESKWLTSTLGAPPNFAHLLKQKKKHYENEFNLLSGY